jgi:hypothetical protein
MFMSELRTQAIPILPLGEGQLTHQANQWLKACPSPYLLQS